MSTTIVEFENKDIVVEMSGQGPMGPRGYQGEQGPQGIQGPQGETGPQGPQGIQGEQGIQGPKGDTGAKGDKGDTGATGATGPQGPQGETGPQGPQGEPGASEWGAITGNLADQSDLAAALDDKAAVITETASGAIAHIEDGAAAPVKSLTVGIEPVQDLHGYDNPWPAGGGKNLLKTGGLTYAPPSDTSFGNGTKRTFTFGTYCYGIASNNYYTSTHTTNISVYENHISFTAGSQSAYAIVNIPVSLTIGETYTLSATKTNGIFSILFYQSDGTYMSSTNASTFTVPADTYYTILSFRAGNADSDVSFTDIQLEKGSTATAFAPYENICPISGHTSATVTRTGKNLFAGYGERTYIKPDTWYVFSSDTLPNSGTSRIRFRLYDKDGTAITGASTVSGSDWYVASNGQVANNTGNITSLTNRKLCITDAPNLAYIVFLDDSSTSYGYVNFTNIQLELGSTATSYEPYQGQQISLDWQTEAGTVYRGELNVTNGTLKATHRYLDLSTITNGWNRVPSQGIYFFYYGLSDGSRADNPDGLCSAYPMTTAVPMPDKSCRLYGSANYNFCRLAIRDDRYETTAEFGQAMAGYHVIYELAEPLTYQFTPQQIQTLLGVNNVFASTGDVTVGYRADTKLYIQRLTQPTEDDMVANANIASGKFFMVGNSLFFSTASIAAGEAIVPGTNCTALSLADALNNLNV